MKQWILLAMCLISPFIQATEIHQHKMLAVPEHLPVPEIELAVTRDPVDGVNVAIALQHYELNSPATAIGLSEASTVLEGHAHVFVNGQKMQRLYGTDIHIPATWLGNGVNQIAISLNSHAHENWTVNGNHIVSTVFVNLAEPELVLHHFSSQPMQAHHGHH